MPAPFPIGDACSRFWFRRAAPNRRRLAPPKRHDILWSSWCEAGVRLGRQMRLVASVQNPAPSSRVSERDPLPPEDRTPVRSDPPRTSLEALYRAQAPRLLRFFSRRTEIGRAHV